MRRALLSVSDKIGLVEFARGLAARGFELVSTGGTATAIAGGRPAGDQRVGGHRLPRDDGRPREDAAPGHSRRHPGAPPRCRRPGGGRRRGHRPHRRGGREPLSVRADRGQSRAPRSTSSSRTSTSAGRAWCAPRPRTSATCSSWSTRPTTARCWRRSTQAGRREAARFDLARRAFAHTGRLRHDHRRGARHDSLRWAAAPARGPAAARAGAARRRGRQGARPALRREPAPAGELVCGGRRPAWAGPT